ncbi:hypothetical protein [Nocardia sp. NPDC050406]|uniref:hypothetical protein n=1 Tax=Nocardia sp. NPDC050406 TaxID=3364318 RepID=UPI003791E55E
MRRSTGWIGFGALLVGGAILCGVATPAHASPRGESPRLEAANQRDARARVAVTGGRLVQDGRTGIVSVVGRAGTVYASFIPEVYVDGVRRPVIAVIDASETILTAVVMEGLREGNTLVTAVADRGTGAVDACTLKGEANALTGAIQGALSGALPQRLSLDASTVVTRAAVAGGAGVWRGDADGCVTGLRRIAA